ncbi:Protein ERGIC-53-like protein [Pteropus alecto]|uniref:Protein ERGIC-53-like protein n=1 Tax=Pteropus alecto TaxID=9402 RepID=L5JWR1_PTEAL|nr:Protein ERGIC-53-like protein [Pteropus alecto]
MLVVSRPDPFLYLLLLLLLAPHSLEGCHPPQRRFEYKLSFKGPRLELPGAEIPFWSLHGDAILGLEEVRLAPSMRNRSGAMWSRARVLFSGWEVELQMRVTGPGRRGAQGMSRGQIGSVLGGLASRDGIGILFDSSAQDTENSPAIRVLASNGHIPYELLRDEASQVLGSCYRDFRNRPYPFRVQITYWGQRLRHPLQPFLEMEQLRLARQLKELRARLALGIREDTILKLSSKDQEEGERIYYLEEILGRHSQILQALQGLSKQLAQAERQWKKQLGSPDQTRPEGAWDSAKVSTLLCGQQTLLQDLQEMRDAATHMASRAKVFYLPVGIKHHFLELDQILSLLQEDLLGPVKASTKDPRPPGQPPGTSSCLQPYIFLFVLLVQTVGFFCYVHFRQKLDKRLQDCLHTGPLPPSPEPCIPRALGALRRHPLSPSMHA